MKPLSIATAVAVALTFGATVASAQTGPNGGNGQNPMASLYPTAIGSAAAHIGDGADPNYLKTQQELTTEPGYSVGTGAVAKNATPQNGSK
ncbi:MAG TPA: hypothetical protein VME47_24670 [Acetobacteraceae bacterium]|nr:hypothetical protein [Acetobacteraceae bacterium]